MTTSPPVALALAVLAAAPAMAAAQEAPPSGLARVELERSRQCVDVIARMTALEQELEPLAAASQRLGVLANAIALEDRTGAEPFDGADPVEAAVAAWFDRDAELAQRYLDTQDPEVLAEREAGREAIKATVSEALATLQGDADRRISMAGELTTSVGGCDGAILVRSAVLEACRSSDSPVCEAARQPAEESRFRFVDAPENLWDVQEMRPWTSPGPLGVTPDGQLGGARTLAYARNGNLTLTLAFGPLLAERETFTPEELQRFQAINDSVGFAFTHPQIAFVPSLALRASAPEPLAGETAYVLHFGEPGEPDVIWAGPSGTGEAVQAAVPLSPAHMARLGSGHPVRFTAVQEDEGQEGVGSIVYSIQFTPLNQGPAVSALMGYMVEQLGTDVAQLVPTERR